MPPLSAIILAGGHSRRMGQDKALLTLSSGQRLLAHTAEVALQLTNDVVVVTPWPERYRPILSTDIRLVQEQTKPSVTSGLPQTVPPALKPSAGPLSGFAQGWAHITSPWCLLLACDLPHLQSKALQQWWQWVQAQPHPVASLTSTQRSPLRSTPIRWEPLCGFYHRSCLPGLIQQVTAIESACLDISPAPSRSFQSWLQTLAIEPYTALPQQMLFNCNTPQDWDTVKDSVASHADPEAV